MQQSTISQTRAKMYVKTCNFGWYVEVPSRSVNLGISWQELQNFNAVSSDREFFLHKAHRGSWHNIITGVDRGQTTVG